MRVLFRLLLLSVVFGVAGCSNSREKAAPAAPTPLSVDEWQRLPVETKYEPETFERLKLADPKLKGERQWQRFFAAVIVPNRKKDIPTPGAKP